MVVGYQYIMNGTQAEAVVPELLLERANSNSYIYDKSFFFSIKVVAVATAAAAKGYKS